MIHAWGIRHLRWSQVAADGVYVNRCFITDVSGRERQRVAHRGQKAFMAASRGTGSSYLDWQTTHITS